jgi:glycosyltransferase involved in cell wall biosynthesis
MTADIKMHVSLVQLYASEVIRNGFPVIKKSLKLLFLCKRRPMGRDLLTRPYGRFFYLPKLLAERGHDVRILLLDYRGGEPLDVHAYGIRCISVPLKFHKPVLYTESIRRLVAESRPDWLIGLSDTYYGILAGHYGKRYGVRVSVDAYDNYESYISWLKPLHWLWRNTLKSADLVTAAGPGLLEKMSYGRNNRPSVVVPMAADPIGFKPMEKEECRLQMGLPAKGKLIGYCGSMHRNRGVEVLFEAVELLQNTVPEAVLVVSGRISRDVNLPSSVHSLGYVEDEKMPVLMNSLDCLAVLNRDSAFGNFSYPVKLYEAMSCRVPVVVTRTRSTEWILGAMPEYLVPPADPQSLCRALASSLRSGPVDFGAVPDWQSSCDIMEQALLEDMPGSGMVDISRQ